jgi:threonine/homoserine/homoserine lactone efflux protein
MAEQASMFETIIKGLLIGLIVSAPMGPIGVLCVQRTLNRGRWHGFVTGLGAVASDLLYAIVTGWGMNYVIDFIEANKTPIQLCGSVFLFIFSYFVFRSNPIRRLTKQSDNVTPYWQDFVTAFFLTLSNVTIIFFYIALFARFNFINPENPLINEIVGIFCIGVGAVGWWVFISGLVHRLRERFNPRGLKAFNILLGCILIIIGIIGLITGFYDLNLGTSI